MNTDNTTMTQAQPLIHTLPMTLGAPMSDDPSNPAAIEIPLQIELPNGQSLFAAVALGGLPFDGQRQIAERIAAAWNAFAGVATQEIQAPVKCLHQTAEPAAQAPDDAQIKALMRKHRIWIEHSTLLEDNEPERELRTVQAEEHQFNAFLQELIAAAQPKAQAMDALTQAVLDVLAERKRQVEQEGYDPAHDDSHVNDEIAAMAAIFLMPEAARDWDARSTSYGNTMAEALLPPDWNFPRLGSRRDQLVKGTAMALAEIERTDRGAHHA